MSFGDPTNTPDNFSGNTPLTIPQVCPTCHKCPTCGSITYPFGNVPFYPQPYITCGPNGH